MPEFSISEWLDMMGSTITIKSFVSRSKSGVPTYAATATSYSCYIEMKNRLIVDKMGREIVSRGRIFVGTTDVIGTEDLLTMPSGYTPLTPPIIAVNLADDENGTHHVTLEIG